MGRTQRDDTNSSSSLTPPVAQIVGKSFGYDVTSEAKHIINIYALGVLAVLAWKI